MNTFKDSLQNINAGSILEELFDVVRIVDPAKKCSLAFNETKDFITCHQFWQRSQPCINCISQRALNDKESLVKLETVEEKLFLVMVLPLYLDNKSIALELLKEIPPESVFGDLSQPSFGEIPLRVNSINNSLVTDELTKVFNKKYINERLPFEISKGIKNNQPLSVIMADIDHFKAVNDTYGHMAGDFVLQELGGVLSEQMVESRGWPARFGGEEFLICLPDTGREAAHSIAEDLRKLAENKEFFFDGNIIRVTLSFGCCTVQEQEILPEELMDCADKRLYQAKHAGRNQVKSSTWQQKTFQH